MPENENNFTTTTESNPCRREFMSIALGGAAATGGMRTNPLSQSVSVKGAVYAEVLKTPVAGRYQVIRESEC